MLLLLMMRDEAAGVDVDDDVDVGDYVGDNNVGDHVGGDNVCDDVGDDVGDDDDGDDDESKTLTWRVSRRSPTVGGKSTLVLRGVFHLTSTLFFGWETRLCRNNCFCIIIIFSAKNTMVRKQHLEKD